MQIEQIEHFLRQSPKVATPAELLERLRSEINLAAVQSARGDLRATKRSAEATDEALRAPSFFKRWLPALSVAVWLLACLVILAVQSNVLQKLRFENRVARAAATLTEQRVQAPAADAELMRLRAEADEAQKLRAEIAQLTSQLSEAQKIRAENQRLAAELNAAPKGTADSAPQAEDFFAHAVTLECVNNLKQVGLGARMWANEHKENLPTSFDQMQDKLPNKAVLFCPASGGTLQYELISPGADESDPSIVYARCPRHNIVVLTDGSAQQLGKKLKVVARPDGKMVVGR